MPDGTPSSDTPFMLPWLHPISLALTVLPEYLQERRRQPLVRRTPRWRRWLGARPLEVRVFPQVVHGGETFQVEWRWQRAPALASWRVHLVGRETTMLYLSSSGYSTPPVRRYHRRVFHTQPLLHQQGAAVTSAGRVHFTFPEHWMPSLEIGGFLDYADGQVEWFVEVGWQPKRGRERRWQLPLVVLPSPRWGTLLSPAQAGPEEDVAPCQDARIRIVFEGASSREPGDVVRARVHWQDLPSGQRLHLRGFWHWGNRTRWFTCIVHEETLVDPPPQGEQPLAFRLPPAPWSLATEWQRIVWYLEATAHPAGVTTRVPFTVVPQGHNPALAYQALAQ